jgi:hypothetical protein
MSFDETKHPRAKTGQFAQKRGTAPDEFLLGAFGTAEDTRNFTELKYIHDRDIDIYGDAAWKKDVQLATLANTNRLLNEGVELRDEHKSFITEVNRAAHPQPVDLVAERYPDAVGINLRRYDSGRLEPVMLFNENDEGVWSASLADVRGDEIPGLAEAINRLPTEAFVKTGRSADYRPELANPRTDHDLGYVDLTPRPAILADFPEATNVHAVEQGGVLIPDYAETDNDDEESFYDFSAESQAAVAASWTPENPGKWEPWDDNQNRWVLRVAPFPEATDPFND